MSSKKFVLSDVANKDMCVKFMIVVIMLSILAIAVFVGIYAFRTSRNDETGCKSPELDPNGLSNWTIGAEVIAFGCFPGHQIEGTEDVLISHCIDGNDWYPPPPACAALPLKIECTVDQNGLNGLISMWQISNTTPTIIHGFLNTTNVDKSKIVLSERIFLSRQNCTTSTDFNSTLQNDALLNDSWFDNLDPIVDEGDLEIFFNSTQLLAYKKAELRVTMVFIDIPTNLTATLVSVLQGSNVLVMKAPLPKPPVGWSFSGGNTDDLVEGTIEVGYASLNDQHVPNNNPGSIIQLNSAVETPNLNEEIKEIHNNGHELPTPLPHENQDSEPKAEDSDVLSENKDN